MVRASAGILDASGLGELVAELRKLGFTVYAPVLDRGSLRVTAIESADELPRGVVDEQDAGVYRLHRKGELYFDYTVAAGSWKSLFFPARLRTWRSAAGDGRPVEADDDAKGPFALLGVRGCDLEAIRIQDRVFLGGAHPDPHYRARREGAFIVAVNCARAASTCFCTSMGTGPKAAGPYDLALTELGDGRFYAEASGDRGASVLAALPRTPAQDVDVRAAREIVEAAAGSMTRSMPDGIALTLREALSSPRWQSIADRCLACGNCTLVCPTCFCSAVENTTDLEGNATYTRRWDSCFSAGHSYIHGGSVRGSTGPRYRQWLTHKLSTWHDQFGSSGCTGCGRCIAWCPVGIDITAEAHAFTSDAAGGRA